MYSLAIVIISAIVCLLLGLGVGLLVGRRSSADSKKFREAERKLDQVIQDKRAYEDEVVDHFSKTARLLNSLTDSYREVHNHLATGAATLCHGQGPIAMDRLQRAGDAEIPAHLANIQPPLDYAPKSTPGEKGMLAEEFGLERHRPSRRKPEPETDDDPAQEDADGGHEGNEGKEKDMAAPEETTATAPRWDAADRPVEGGEADPEEGAMTDATKSAMRDETAGGEEGREDGREDAGETRNREQRA